MVFPLCSAQIALMADEVAYLEGLPQAAHEVEAESLCEVEAGHAGPHLALGQSFWPDSEVWIRWSPATGLRELATALGECTAERVSLGRPDDEEYCALPAHHVGHHSFDLEEGRGRIPTAQWRARLEAAYAQIAEDDQLS